MNEFHNQAVGLLVGRTCFLVGGTKRTILFVHEDTSFVHKSGLFRVIAGQVDASQLDAGQHVLMSVNKEPCTLALSSALPSW